MGVQPDPGRQALQPIQHTDPDRLAEIRRAADAKRKQYLQEHQPSQLAQPSSHDAEPSPIPNLEAGPTGSTNMPPHEKQEVKEVECKTCGGTGKTGYFFNSEECETCHGRGKLKHRRTPS